MTFGEKLKAARLNTGLKQAELGRHIGTKGNTISNWESNINRPNLDTLARLCRVLNVEPSYFFEARVSEDKEDKIDKLTFTEINLIEKYRRLDEHGKKCLTLYYKKNGNVQQTTE